MKKIYIFIFLIINLVSCFNAYGFDTNETPWKLSIVTSNNNSAIIINSSSNQHFHVVLKNRNKNVQKIWMQSNSWGYSILSFIITDDTGKKYSIRKLQKNWRKNIPAYKVIKNDECFIFNVLFNDKVWDIDKLKKISNKHNMQIHAVIKIPNDEMAREKQVWSGIIKSEKYSAILE